MEGGKEGRERGRDGGKGIMGEAGKEACMKGGKGRE